MLTSIRRFFIGLACVSAFIAVVGACSIIESPDFTLGLVIPWILIFIGCGIVAVILDRPSRVSRYFVAAHICILAWKYLHNFTYNKNAKYCAVMKHRYHTYSDLYRRVVEWYKYELDDGERIF